MLTKAPKGTRDILPSEVRMWQYVEETYRKLADLYGFSEIRTPIFEHTELFNRGIGDTTDVVEKQMYTFNDMKNRSISLKPEGTAGIVRAFIENKMYAGTMPLKLCYTTPCFRYENTQKGRQREFHQFGVEVFGSNDMLADAEVIAFAADFLNTLGIPGISLRINSIGCPTCRAEYRKALQDFLRGKYEDLCNTCKGRFDRNPMRILDCKSPDCQALVKGAPVMMDYLCDDCRQAFEELKSNLDAMGIEYTVDTGIVRGLDYYTKTAFEFVTDAIGAQGTVCGGGRYDNLVESVGGPATPGIGFGLGIERLLLVMEAAGIRPAEEENIDVFVAFMGDAGKKFAQDFVQKLRKAGLRAQLDTAGRNIKGQFKYADRLGAKYTVVAGDDEIASGKFTLKNMKTSEQTQMDAENIIEEVLKNGRTV